MSFLAHLYRSARNEEPFVAAALAELLNSDIGAQRVVLDALQLGHLGPVTAWSQYPLWAEDGTYLGQADVFLAPTGRSGGAVLETKVETAYQPGELDRYNRATNVGEIRFLARSLDDVDPSWHHAAHTWNRIYQRLYVLEVRHPEGIWRTAFLELLETLKLAGSIAIRRLPLARLHGAGVAIHPAHQALGEVLRGMLGHKLQEAVEAAGLTDDGALSWSWELDEAPDGCPIHGLAVSVEPGPTSGALVWTLWVGASEAPAEPHGWDEGGWWSTELPTTAFAEADIADEFRRLAGRIRHIVVHGWPASADFIGPGDETPPTTISVGEVQRTLHLLVRTERALQPTLRRWRDTLRSRAAETFDHRKWVATGGGHNPAGFADEGGTWQFTCSVDWNGRPGWRLTIWHPERVRVDEVQHHLDVEEWHLTRQSEYAISLTRAMDATSPWESDAGLWEELVIHLGPHLAESSK